MAKVKCMPSNTSSSFFANDAPLPEVLALEISAESPPKCDFDIVSLLSDNETHSEHQHIDNWRRTNTDNKGSDFLSELLMTPNSTEKTINCNSPSLVTSPDNHFQKDRMLSAWGLDDDFNPSDILCNDNCSFINSKNTISFESLLDPHLEKESNLSSTVTGKEVPIDDLLDLVAPVSLETLATNHFLSNDSDNKVEKKSSDSFLFSLKNDNSDNQLSFLDNLLSLNEQECNSTTETYGVNILTRQSSTDSSEINYEKPESSSETSDYELIPDIDLTNCIKKNSKNASSPYVESEDSGFDETDFGSFKFSTPPEDSVLLKNSHPFEKGKQAPFKESLFSRCISAKPEIDDIKKAKLNKVRNALLKKSFPMNMIEYNKQKKSVSERIVDNSNTSVVMSNFLEVLNGHLIRVSAEN